jgi:hypothetical protein
VREWHQQLESKATPLAVFPRTTCRLDQIDGPEFLYGKPDGLIGFPQGFGERSHLDTALVEAVVTAGSEGDFVEHGLRGAPQPLDATRSCMINETHFCIATIWITRAGRAST